MGKNKISRKQFAVYMIAAFGSAWILEMIGSIFGNNGNQTVFGVILVIAMFMPFLGVLIARIPLKGMGWVPHLKGKIRYVFFALWMPALLSILGGVLFFAIFPDAFDSEFLTIHGILEEAGALEQFEAQGLTIPMYLLVTGIQAVTFAPFLNMFAALGEEIGWRGAMYPYLKESLGVTKGRIAGGAIWGAWHWPAMIFAGYEYGKEYIGAPVLGPVVFCICTVMMGILLDYVYEKTETIWLPSLMHGAINAFTYLPYLTKPEYADKAILGPAYIGIISMIPMMITAVIICIKKSPSPSGIKGIKNEAQK
ncbi:MAG: CPBP family intramembrane metalloprotease [Lachnoclostridium sp.]|nr:CPBP family intramembrane metalloprotease [Lachnospira sp.]MCM1248350.1 CPBP family intramembrane metalloprotease [Lachnoclostridium sp.]MCM1536603.1 CPBP family intramembrane metalloprotease [Clostridium sp.]